MNRLAGLFCVFFLSFSSAAVAQNLGTGLYAFGSFDSRGFDTVNLGNLNTHFEIPLVSKQGRGMPFQYSLVYDGLIWSSSTTTGTGAWTPTSSWGFSGQLSASGFTGFVTRSITSVQCPTQLGDGGAEPVKGGGSNPITLGLLYSNYVYHDPYGRNHAFDYSLQICASQSAVTTGTGASVDGAGFIFSSLGEAGISSGKILTRSGSVILAPLILEDQTTGNITDTNGNIITNNGNGTFTDTLGVTALTIGGTGSAASPLTFSYPVTLQSDQATTATATIFYKTYTVQTNFGCSGVTEYGATSIDLTDHLTMPDGSTYAFTYEPTPGVSGAVTGRLASITLPTGGTINYAYTGGCNGNGMNADGTVGSLARTTSDGTRSYGRSGVNANATNTTVQDEKGNQSLYQFTISGGFFYETERTIYQGAVGGTELFDQTTCYDGVQSSCDGAGIGLPISETVVLAAYAGGSQLGTFNVYDASGMPTSSVLRNGNTVLQITNTVYNLLEEVTSVTVQNGSGNLASSMSYNYDETTPTATSSLPQHTAVSGQRGNQTSAIINTGTGSLTTSTVYYDTGAPVSTTTPNGTTGYSYDATQTFVTATTLPTPSSGVQLATSAAYDPQSGAQLSATGMNGQTTQVTQYDPLTRPTSVTLPNGSVVTITYSGNDTIVDQTSGTGSDALTYTLVDAYGRKSRVAVFNGQSGNQWYQIDYCYDATGLLQFQSLKYQGSGFAGANATKQCSGSGTSYTYDALGRMTGSSNADGTTSWQYNGRAVLSTDVNGVQKITQHDMLGRISGVCEVSSTTLQTDAPSPCSMDIAGTGFVTNYAYTPANTTTITQGAQTRIFATDEAGRTTSVTEPERGTTTYSYIYNSTGLQVTRTRPQANQTNAAVTHSVTQYDSLGRILSVSYDDRTPTKVFTYDQSTAFGGGSVGLGASKGMLTEAGVTFGTTFSLSVYMYDVMGNVIWSDQCLPSSCGVPNTDKILQYTYDLLGDQTSVSDGFSVTASYTYSPLREVTSITSSISNQTNPSSLVSNVQNGPFGPVSYQLGNGLSQANIYDSLGRPDGGWVCYGSPAPACSSQAYGTFQIYKGSRVTFSSDNVMGQGNGYGYDEFNRLISTSLSLGAQTFSYTYDRYGNRWGQSAPQGGPAPSYTFNKTNNQISSYSYDAAGNILYDGMHTYTYDAEGNITQVDPGSTPTATYYYNALNQRVRADQGSTSREYVYNLSGQRTSIWDGNTRAQLQGQYYWGSRPIAFYSGGNLHFQHQDELGTERVQTSYNGGVEGSFASLPWGDGYSASGSDLDPYHFAQLDQDSESGTQHAQFRQDSSTQGRWMSPDPYDGSYRMGNPQSFNRYGYVMNNPLSMTDPLGLNGSLMGLDFIGSNGCIYDGFTENMIACSGQGLLSGQSGNGTSTTTTSGGALSKDPCANASLTAAGGVNIRQRIAVTNAAVSSGFAVGGPLGALAAFAYLVHTGGPYDDKNGSGLGMYSDRVDAGNISYGVTCPFGAAFCQFAAGAAQTLGGNPNPNGTPQTGFDTPSDNASIRVGQAMRAAGCHD
jgi:RHS repeat-associated protein